MHEFAHGHHADAADADNPRVRWRYDPAQAGVSGTVRRLRHSCAAYGSLSSPVRRSRNCPPISYPALPSRVLEDDAMVNFRMDGGTVGRLWTSSVAIGRQHGLDIQVFGEKGGLRWSQEQPNQLYWMPLNGRLQVIERGEANLSPEADRATRVTIGHAEGMPLAFANIYNDLAEAISAQKEGRAMDAAADLYPRAADGLRSMAAVFAVAESGKADGNGWMRVHRCSASEISGNRASVRFLYSATGARFRVRRSCRQKSAPRDSGRVPSASPPSIRSTRTRSAGSVAGSWSG